MLSAKWRATWLMGSHQWIQASLSMSRPLQTGQHKVTKRIIWFINISKLFLIVSHYSFIAQMSNQQNQEKNSPFCPQSNQWRLSLMASLIRSVRITAATILSLSMVSKGSNENPTFFWSHLVDAIEIQISFGVWSHLWQPGQSSMGVSMTCSWSTGALWHWVTHKTTHFDHTISTIMMTFDKYFQHQFLSHCSHQRWKGPLHLQVSGISPIQIMTKLLTML